MTAVVKQQPPSPPMSNDDREAQYSICRLTENSPRVPYDIQTSDLDFDTPTSHLSSGQQSYFQASTPISQKFFQSQPSFYSHNQHPYGVDSPVDREISIFDGKYASNDNMSACMNEQARNVNMGILDAEYGLIDSGYHDSPASSFQSSQHYASNGHGTYAHVGNSMPSPSPSLTSPRRTTRSNGNVVARVVNNGKPAVVLKTGYDGQAQKVTRVCKGVRKRKPTGEKSERPKVPKLTKPLSELTKDYHHLPIKHMEAWVHRSAEVRKQEVEKRGGYVTRPMNSFMLYRSAFAERTKLWCLQNNHQVVSSVSGESWPLEPAEIRDKYNELAKIERSNHQAAHPGYKFSPSKAQSVKKRRSPKGEEDTEASELDDLEDGDEYGGPKNGSKGKKNTGGNNHKSANISGAGIGRYMGLSYDYAESGAQRSSFTHNNPGKKPPVCMGSTDMNGQYYQTTVRASSATPIANSMHNAVIEDVTIRKTQAPVGSASLQQAQAPGAYHDSHMDGYGLRQQQQESQARELEPDNAKVDPALLAEDSGNGSSYHDSQFQNSNPHNILPSHFVDEGHYEPGNFEIDPLFSTVSGGAISDLHFPNGNNSSEAANQFHHNGLLDSDIDVHNSGYEQTMQNYLDTVDSWNMAEETVVGDGEFRYDEWLQ
ncbi:hypothetical protein RUND412_000368 [Rhizina undulata]